MALELKGTPAAALPRKSRAYRGGRVCSVKGCETKLSIYNRRDTCFQHSSVRIPRLRGRKATV